MHITVALILALSALAFLSIYAVAQLLFPRHDLTQLATALAITHTGITLPCVLILACDALLPSMPV